MTDTKVVAAQFESNGGGFSATELTISHVPGTISKPEARPANLPVYVLEHLRDWAQSGLDAHATVSTEAEDRVRAIVREELSIELAAATRRTTEAASEALRSWRASDGSLGVVDGDGDASVDVEEPAGAIDGEGQEPSTLTDDLDDPLLQLLRGLRADVVRIGAVLENRVFPVAQVHRKMPFPPISLVDEIEIGPVDTIRIKDHGASPSADGAGAHSVGDNPPAPADKPERAKVGEALLEHLAASRRRPRRPASPDWMLETQLLLIRTVLATHTVGGREKLAEIDAELGVLRSRMAEEAAQSDLDDAQADARSTLGSLNSQLRYGGERR